MRLALKKMPKRPTPCFLYKNMAYRKKTMKRTYKRKSAKRRGVRRPALKKMIRREIARNVENKTAQYFEDNLALVTYPSGNFDVMNIQNCGLDSALAVIINQGTSQGARIGNAITTKKLTFKGTIWPAAYSASTNLVPAPVQGKIWIFYDKINPTVIPSVKGNNDFLQLGGSSSTFRNDLTDMWAPVNKDRYRVLATKTFKLGFADYAGTGNLPGSQYFANNDFKMNYNFSFNLTKHFPKRVKFNDNNADPVTRGLFFMVEYVGANGNNFFPATMLNMSYSLDYVFEDA